MDLSVIIVSYNVKFYLLGLLHSLTKSLDKKLTYEIIIIDNHSSDQSATFINRYFDNIVLIENQKNIGFSAANNLGIKKARGRFIALINPDTLVEEDLFVRLADFMNSNTSVGAITAKMINSDGSFAIDCRHGVPTPKDALWKSIGFSRLFPNNPLFSQYHQTHLDVNIQNEIPALSGAFMFLRSEAVKTVGFMDENFFMYCEDIDYCSRLAKKNWKIIYYPHVTLLHFKGASTKKSDYNYIKNFNSSMKYFFNKHYARSYSIFAKYIINVGIFLRGILILFNNTIQVIVSGSKSDQGFCIILTSNNKNKFEKLLSFQQVNLCNDNNIELISNDLNNPNNLKTTLKKNKIKTIIFDVEMGYKNIFKLLQALQSMNIESQFYYEKWQILISKNRAIQIS